LKTDTKSACEVEVEGIVDNNNHDMPIYLMEKRGIVGDKRMIRG